METFSNVPGSVVQAANVLAWDLKQSMFCKSLDPILEHADDWLSHVEDNVINQLEVDRPALLMNWQLIESLIDDILKVT